MNSLLGAVPGSRIPRISTHTHTNLSHCGRPEMSLEAVSRLAADLDYALLALTDHIHIPEVTDYAYHLARLEEYKAWRGQEDLPFELVVGGEFEVAEPGRIIAPAALVDACECAVVAPNHYQLDWVVDPPDDLPGAAAHELRCIQTVLDWPAAQAVAHPFFGGGTVHTTDDLFSACDRKQVEDLIAQAVARGVAFEIQPKFWANPTARSPGEFFDQVLARGGKVALGSDAHALTSLAAWAEQVEAIARRFALEPGDVWWPASHLDG